MLREEVSSLVKTVPGPVASVSLRIGECALDVTWASAAGPQAQVAQAPVAQVVAAEPAGEAEAARDAALHEVTAPLVGTFYVAPEPGAGPFVKRGDRVEAGQTIGIVEAMKLMNPVAAERAGEVVEVLVGDGEPVEFGQCLVRVRTDTA
nr:acetyl-CoA carboxylase biotin carboxyl carrier protein [Planomonospora venezuelensis]